MLRRLVTQSTERLLREPSPAKSTMRDTRPLITRWRTRLCLLMLYASVSIVVSIVNVLTSLLQADDGVRVVVLLIDRILIFCHGVALVALFGFADDVTEPIFTQLRRWLAACLLGNPEAPITAFPPSASGFWG